MASALSAPPAVNFLLSELGGFLEDAALRPPRWRKPAGCARRRRRQRSSDRQTFVKKLIGAAGLTAIALFMLLGFLNADLGGGAASLVALLLVVGLPAAGAAMLTRSHFAERSRLSGRKALLRQHTLDAEILRLAGERGGRLTVVEVATEVGVSLEGAKEALDGLLLREHADLELTDTGVTVYHFYDVKNLGDKHTARGILDA